MDERETGASTRAVHAGSSSPEPGAAVVNPIVQSATFYSEPGGGGEVRYTRYGNNPTHQRLAERLRALEETESALVLASGNAAMALALLSSLEAGDHIVAGDALYGGTLRLLTRELPRLGIETTFVPHEGEWRTALRPRTRVLLVEIPVNPTLRIRDPRPLARLAHEAGARLIVDATFATPLHFRPAAHGADLVVHSATKYLGGHCDLMAGVVAGREPLVEAVRQTAMSFGPVLDPHAAWLLERGLKTLAVRMERHDRNGRVVAGWLEGHPAVSRVHYPGLESHPDHALARELFSDFGGMVSMVVGGGDDAALRVMGRLRLMCAAPSLGGVETLVSMPRFTSHASVSEEKRAELGIGPGFVRLSLGIEDAADLIADLEQALAAEIP